MLVTVLALAVAIVGIPAAGLAVYWRGIRRVVKRAGPGSWTVACIDPRRPRSWRALVVDGTGLHLWRVFGGPVHTWPWPEVSSVTAGPVRPTASVVAHRGLHLWLADGSTAEFLFPSRTTLRYPPGLLDRVLQELARCGKHPVVPDQNRSSDSCTRHG